VAIGLCSFMMQLVLAMRGFPMSIKLCLLAILPGMHTLHPIYGIGMDEAMLVFFGQVTGMLCGHAIHLDQLLLVAAVEVANMNRRADSRLNHVIKGQCGGASALLSGLRRMLELDGRAPTDEIGEIMQQIQGMLDDAADWCHSREVFVQLEAGTYQVRARAAPARSARARAAAITAGAPAASAAIYLLDAPHSGEWAPVAGGASYNCAPAGLFLRSSARLSATGSGRSLAPHTPTAHPCPPRTPIDTTESRAGA
jgi:hypothetical protein